MLGEIVVKRLNKKGKIIGTLSNKNKNMQDRMEGFMEVVSNYPDIEVLSFEATEQPNVEERWQSLKKTMQKYPDFNCFVCMDAMGSFFARRIKRRLKNNPALCCFDKTEDSKKPMEDGYLYVLAQRPRLWENLQSEGFHESCGGKPFLTMKIPGHMKSTEAIWIFSSNDSDILNRLAGLQAGTGFYDLVILS